jgi:hypothetical protein
MQPVWPLNRRFQALPLRPPARWVLESIDDGHVGSHVQVVFQGLHSGAIEGSLEIREICRVSAGAVVSHYLIDRMQGTLPVAARGLHVHETPGPGYQSVLPRQSVSLKHRWLWRLLLAVLRIPGAFAVISRFRRARR